MNGNNVVSIVDLGSHFNSRKSFLGIFVKINAAPCVTNSVKFSKSFLRVYS